MKKFIFRIFYFILFLTLFYSFGVFIYGNTFSKYFNSNLRYVKGKYGHLYSRLKEAEKTKNVDILFLGSSHTYRGFDPRIFKKFGYTSFNLGSSAQTPMQTKVLLKRYLKGLDPKIVIYEIYPGTFNSDGIEASLDLISNDDESGWNEVKLALKQNNLKVYNTLFYDLFDQEFNNSDFLEEVIKGGDTYISGGYVEQKMNYFKVDQDNHQRNEKWNFKEIQFSSFEENLETLKNEGFTVILVYAPITKFKYLSKTNNKDFNSKIKRISQAKSLVYFNFNNGYSNLNDSLHFYDSHHLNQKGVEIFNKSLIDSLSKLDFDR